MRVMFRTSNEEVRNKMKGHSKYGFEMIRRDEIEKITKREKTLIIDLRSAEKFREGHLQNARNFPFEYIEEWKSELPEYISVILYCEHGNQSLLAARKLRGRNGNIYTMTGGYQGMKEA